MKSTTTEPCHTRDELDDSRSDPRIDLAQALILKGLEEEGLAHLAAVDAMYPGYLDVERLVAALRAERGIAD